MLATVEGIARRGDLLSIFVMVFLADVAIGIYRATFSLFADSLGATLTMIGIIGSIEGLTVLLTSVPIGSLSDRIERRTVVGGGLLLFAVAYSLCALSGSPALLFPIRALVGVGVASTFYVGIALLSDRVDRRQQGLSIGIYTTCMGVGFAVGSAIGGRLAEDHGYVSGFAVAAVIVMGSFAVLRLGPAWRSVRRHKRSGKNRESLTSRLALLRREPVLLAACVGYLGIAMANEGAVFNFYPLYAASLLIGPAVIGSMFSARMLASSAARLPAGALADLLSSRRIMAAAMILSILSLVGIALTTSAALLTVLLVGEGIAFGAYFASGSAAIAKHTVEDNRGIATGLFIMAGSIGVTLGPLALGVTADLWGLNTVFLLTAATLLLGLVAVIVLYSANSSRRTVG
jgi:MFS family permease